MQRPNPAFRGWCGAAELASPAILNGPFSRASETAAAVSNPAAFFSTQTDTVRPLAAAMHDIADFSEEY